MFVSLIGCLFLDCYFALVLCCVSCIVCLGFVYLFICLTVLYDDLSCTISLNYSLIV